MIATEWPRNEADELDAVQRVLASGQVNYWNGDEGRCFEREFAAFHDSPHGVVCANGTVALELALRAVGVGAGDEVVVTPRSFMATASSVVMVGAQPVFADVEPESGNVTPETVSAALSPRTRAILPVHLAGWPCDLPGLRALADAHELALVEDCAQAHGARLDGHAVGCVGDAAAFSFCTDKIISTGGEGGMVLCRDEAVRRRVWSLKDHGRGWDAVYNREHPPGFRWLNESFGTNGRLTEMQSAIGRVQLGKLPQWLAARRRNAGVLIERLADVPGLRVPLPGEGIEHAWYKLYAFLRPEELAEGWHQDAVIAAIRAEGVPCLHGGCSEIYLEQAFHQPEGVRALGPDGVVLGPENRLPVARELGETSLMLPVDHTLSADDMARIADGVVAVMRAATR